MNIYDIIYEIDCADSAFELRRIAKKAQRIMPEQMQSINVAIDQRFELLNSVEVGPQKARWE